MKSTFKASILFVMLLLVTGFMGNTILDIQHKPAGSGRAPLQEDAPSIVTQTESAIPVPTKKPEKQRSSTTSKSVPSPTVTTPLPTVITTPPAVVAPKSSTKTRSS